MKEARALFSIRYRQHGQGSADIRFIFAETMNMFPTAGAVQGREPGGRGGVQSCEGARTLTSVLGRPATRGLVPNLRDGRTPGMNREEDFMRDLGSLKNCLMEGEEGAGLRSPRRRRIAMLL